ncbi:hypothetical protein LOTGIDRAFT_229265 [Lottia gigantea]|uniref:RRM domain-containing protein n=1 Tax=Lottia gigantea TaxID=225164 RepID=V3ZRY3_LOTGI|nr:hypothetical protein LOTGIDRAFT_229265 [Lottia gigantea]ESO87107.1 hypothetical protein LOTGIDRAFT_229265 [Lottia gigantea]
MKAVKQKEKRKNRETFPLNFEIICPKKIKIVGHKKGGVVKKTSGTSNGKSSSSNFRVSDSKSQRTVAGKKKYDYKLVVKNLSFEVGEADLRKIFLTADKITLSKFTDTGKSKGYAFAEYQSKQDAKEAQHALNRRKIKGRRVSIHFKGIEDLKSHESKLPTPKNVNLYPNKQEPRIQAPKKQFVFADDSD